LATSSIERQVCACPRPFKAQPPREANGGENALNKIIDLFTESHKKSLF